LLDYCQARDWAGYDPYDALNSRLFRALPFLDFKAARLGLTQVVKRSPINLRPLLLVPPSHNPKGLALFLVSLLKLSRAGCLQPEREQLPAWMVKRLLELRSPGVSHWTWGYNFDWQTRFLLVPSGSPNIICTTFVVNALLDWFERTQDGCCLEAAVSGADFILEVLYWESRETPGCFSYTPLWRSEVHNASLLGAALLCRVARLSGQTKFVEPALKAARNSVAKQHSDGAWDYGESDQPSQRWKDNFHTGYNLCALQTIGRETVTEEFDASIGKGLDYYLAHFFREDGAPKYYHDRVFPVDVHSVSQSVLTLLAFQKVRPEGSALARRVLAWGLDHLWDKRGFFYCQKHPRYTITIPYMRWAQAWMLLALSAAIEDAAGATGTQSAGH
jgi:hypothetical protein